MKMRKGEVLKSLLSDDSGLKVKMTVQFRGVPEPIDADVAIKIWEQLNAIADASDQDPRQRAEPKKEKPADAKKPGKPKKKLDDGKMLALRKAGWTYEKIADEMGCSTQTVINHIKERERQ